MALNDLQIRELADKMNVPLAFVGFKDELLAETLQYNKFYVINLEDEFDEKGFPNDGSHWTSFQVNKYKTGVVEPIYFDPYGQIYPTDVATFIGMKKFPYNTKDIQSIVNNACGWYVMAFGHYINSYPNRTGDIYSDTQHFLDLFEDLSISTDHLKNEFVLKHFFRSCDPEVRKKTPVRLNYKSEHTVDPETISSENGSIMDFV